MRPHHKLIAWQEAMKLVKNVYSLSSKLPVEEKYNLASQLRRAAVSIPTNIAEGAARSTRKEFRQFLFISSGSLSEVETLIRISVDLGFIPEGEATGIEKLHDKVSARINGLIKSMRS